MGGREAAMSSNIGAIVAVNAVVMNRVVSLGRRATESKRRKGARLWPGKPEGKQDPNPGYGAESFSFHVTCYKYH